MIYIQHRLWVETDLPCCIYGKRGPTACMWLTRDVIVTVVIKIMLCVIKLIFKVVDDLTKAPSKARLPNITTFQSGAIYIVGYVFLETKDENI